MKTNKFFPEINGNFGFGCMRLPMKDGEVDHGELCAMIDDFISAGFNYFDTAHGYTGGRSETSIRECISKRYPRDKFVLTNKLTDSYFNSQEEIIPFFRSQLEWCGVDYFDFYLMHAQDANSYRHFEKCRAYQTAYALKAQGLIRHFGISFHDKAEVLDMILTEHPEIEVVQIQFNYFDYGSASVDGRGVYKVCEKHGKPVIVMEPVRGGSLVNLPEEADGILRALGSGSNASYALRFAAGFPQIAMVISGMSNVEQMSENIATMSDFKPLDKRESDAVYKVAEVFRSLDLIPCTSCRYCVDQNQCPQNILIPEIFAALNTYGQFKGWNCAYYYNYVLTGGDRGKASECIGCGMCESVCPQHIEIRKYLADAAATFERDEPVEK